MNMLSLISVLGRTRFHVVLGMNPIYLLAFGWGLYALALGLLPSSWSAIGLVFLTLRAL